MYELLEMAMQPQIVVVILVAGSAFATVIMIGEPLFGNNKLDSRMRCVADEREKLKAKRLKEMAEESERRGQLRHSAKTKTEKIVKAFNLREALESEDLALKMKMAGLRGPGPLMTFLVARVVLPIVGLVGAWFYINFINDFGLEGKMRWLAMFGVGYFGFYLPNIFVYNLTQKRQMSIKNAFPDALDLLLICVQAGMSIEAAFRKVASEIGHQSSELAEELTLTTAEMSYLQNRRQAYENLGLRTGMPGVRAVATTLIQSEKYGTPLAIGLRTMADEFRQGRMNEAEKKAASLPPKLTVPMIVFFLPVLFAVILGPAIIKVKDIF